MKTMLSTTHLIAAGVIATAFAAGFFAGPAFAQEQQANATPFDFKFSYSPEELADMPKAKALLNRLERRVRTHCGGDRKMSHAERQLVNACVDETMRSSIDKFGSTAVAQAYQSRAG